MAVDARRPTSGADFNGIFDGLDSGSYDCVIAGTTVTPERERKAAFAAAVSDLGAVARRRHRPAGANVRSVDDLTGLTIGVQRGNTSQPIAERLGRAAARPPPCGVYDYGDVRTALADLSQRRRATRS